MRQYIARGALVCAMVSTMGWGDSIFNTPDPSFTAREIHSLKLAKKWISNGHRSFRGKDGSIVFVYGATLPSVIAAPLRITDMQLQPGERIREVQIGDSVRWQITPSVSGTKPNEVSHIIIKPIDVGLRTTLAVFTDRRTYHINLISSKRRYMPIVSFAYKDEIDAKWAAYRKYMHKQKDAKMVMTSKGKSRNIDSLDFSYRIEGNYYWKPTRVYNDGVKTYIQMPRVMKFRESPVLMVLDNDGKKLVNYRLVNNRYVVDKLFRQAVLIMGVGSSQEKVLITYSKSANSNRTQDILRILRGDE